MARAPEQRWGGRRPKPDLKCDTAASDVKTCSGGECPCANSTRVGAAAAVVMLVGRPIKFDGERGGGHSEGAFFHDNDPNCAPQDSRSQSAMAQAEASSFQPVPNNNFSFPQSCSRFSTAVCPLAWEPHRLSAVALSFMDCSFANLGYQLPEAVVWVYRGVEHRFSMGHGSLL